ncbi:hypothetical protein FRB90_003241 [Tulasnella sp. 427]|nr:hypothetical protein FRB90_003241 [Tulasnella sp. 427]
MPSTTPINTLPNELLLSVFEAVFVLSDSSSAYTTLLNTSRVCRRWGSLAAKVLLSNVEITRRDDALRLIALLESTSSSSPDQPYVESLTVGLGGCDEPQLLDDQLFLRLLSLTPRIRKLNILHQNSLPCLPTQLSALPYLSDVTIAPAGGAPAAMAETTLIQQLPSSVRFLNLPATERTRFVEPAKALCPPSFQLYGLEAQDLPSPSTNWVLGNSKESLQCLSGVYFSKLAELAERHPGVRSVRVLGRLGTQAAKEGFAKFERLERVEMRDVSAPPTLLDTMSNETIQYVRFWSTPWATKMTQMLESGRFPQLKTVVWDHFTPAMKGPAAEKVAATMKQTMNKLQAVCESRGVSLRMAERKDGGLRAGLGKDHAYEASLHDSCFRLNDASVPSSTTITSLTKLPTRVLRHMHKENISMGCHFNAISPFMDRVPGKWPAIWEDIFEGHGTWLEDTLPGMKVDAVVDAKSTPSNKAVVPGAYPIRVRF